MQKALYPQTANDLCYQKGDTEVLITVDTLQPAEYSVFYATAISKKKRFLGLIMTATEIHFGSVTCYKIISNAPFLWPRTE